MRASTSIIARCGSRTARSTEWTSGRRRAKAGKIQHDQFLEVKSGQDEGVIKSSCKWVAPDGKVVCTDERTFRVYNRPANERLFDFEITIKAPADRDVLFGDTKEGTMAVRVNEQMRASHGEEQAGQRAHRAEHWRSRRRRPRYRPGANARRGVITGASSMARRSGIAIFDHPSNPVHPTYWHVRDYGLFAANPFGIHDFEKKEPGAGNLNIPAGQDGDVQIPLLHPRRRRQEGEGRRALQGIHGQEIVSRTAELRTMQLASQRIF